MLQTSTSKLILFGFGLILFSFTGCGPPEAPTGSLIGTVKSGGEPCGNVMVSLSEPNTFVKRGATVDESGNYELKDVLFGEYQVRIVRMPSNSDGVVIDERIPEKYKRVKTSGLTASISSEEPVTLHVDMVK